MKTWNRFFWLISIVTICIGMWGLSFYEDTPIRSPNTIIHIDFHISYTGIGLLICMIGVLMLTSWSIFYSRYTEQIRKTEEKRSQVEVNQKLKETDLKSDDE